jgi:class 3 adenylate cyclase
MRCPACGARTTQRARFCDQCGQPLPGGSGESTGAPVASLEVGDRRVVTALFADLVDYVRMIAEHDPEVVRARVRAALARMADSIERFGGTREKFIGDAVFAVFGWPVAHDDDTVRAAMAAIAIRASLRESDDEGERMQVRIGLATGVVVAADRAATGDLSVTGEAVTTAARIQSLAQPGEILLDEATVRGGRDRLAVEDRGTVVLRGQSSPIHLYALGDTVDVGLAGARRTPSVGPFVGRTPESARLRRILAGSAKSGVGATILIVGDAGMGKSRLVAELEPDAARLGYRWTWTESVSYARGEPYRFARVFAQSVADEHGVDSGTFARQLLFDPDIDEATRRRYGGAIAAIARDANFSGWEAESSDAPVDPTEIAAALGEVGARYIDRLLISDGPRVVVIDDVHWIDPSSASIVALLVATAEVRPLIIIATMRPGPEPEWAGLPTVERISLGGLAPAETARLATIVARAPVDASDARRIHDRTAGNPLFVGETVRASIEDGSLTLIDGRMALADDRALGLPLTLRAVLGARIDGLDEPARTVLGVASVVGIQFSTALVRDLLGRSIPAGSLGRLVDAALVAPATSDLWRFSHPLVRDAAYAGMLASRRRLLHARLADRLEAGPGRTSTIAVAVHRAAAGDAARAVPLLVDAATSTQILGAASEAAGFWRMAAELAPDPVESKRYRQKATALARSQAAHRPAQASGPSPAGRARHAQ